MKNINITESDIWAYISKTADKFTIQKIVDWKKSKDFDQNLFNKISSIYTITGKTTYDNTLDIEASKNKFFTSVSTKKNISNNWKQFFKYAAVITFIITLTYFYNTSQFNNNLITVQTAYGEQQQINLPDSSIIWLNSSSTISYSLKNPRAIYLEGEAYFEVSKDLQHPFTVKTADHLQVKALGTSFNIKSYSKNVSSETVLLTGKVEVTSDKHFKEKIIMIPNDKITFNKNDYKITKSKLKNSEIITAWKKGRIQFNNKSFKEIANDLSIQFNINIHFENEQISNSKFTGSFSNTTPVEEILEILKITKHFKYEKYKNNEWIIK